MGWDLDAYKRHIKEHPEAAMSPEQEAEIAADLERRMAHVRALFDAVRAYRARGEGSLWRWVEEYAGVQPDPKLKETLGLHIRLWGKGLSYFLICRLVNHHAARLRARDQGAWYIAHAGAIYDRLRKDPNHALMRSLRSCRDPYAALRDLIPGALVQAEADGYWGGAVGDEFDTLILHAIESIIVEENRPLRETRKRAKDDATHAPIVSLEALPAGVADAHLDPRTTAAYDGIEDADALRAAISRAGLTQTEVLVLALFLGDFLPASIAEQLGCARDTVYVHLRNIRRKLKAAA
jgi:DNA-binding CsgD family transcriptional regulator